MSDVPASVIAELNALDGYEKMLAIDRVTVEHGVSSEELMRLMEMPVNRNGTCRFLDLKEALIQ